MYSIQIFNNPDFGEIRSVTIDGKPYFVGIEVAKALGYAVPKTATAKHVDLEDRLSTKIEYAGQNRDIVVINESGLYSLIFGSKLESAKKFKKWVTSEVLPSIRKNGGYGVPQTIPEQIQLLAQGNVELNQKVDTLEQRFNKFEDEMPVTGADMDDIQSAVRRKGTEVLGGKESNAYRDRSTRTYVYADIQCELRRQFGVKRYKEIKHKDTKEALRIIEEYRLPLALRNRVETVNAQNTLDSGRGYWNE